MDLPTCPSCNQSVLDEDASDCPFCGASLSGSGKPKAQTSVKPPPSRPMAKPARKLNQEGASAASAQKTAADEEDGHDIIAADQEAIKRAFPVSRQRVKGYTYEVVCPMCEAPGYVPKKAAGMDVKCHNPACMVPIFTAPAIEKKVEEPEPESGLSPLIYGGVAVAVILLGVGGYFLFSRGSSQRRPKVVNTPPPPVATKQIDKTDETEKDPQDVVERGPSLETIQRDALTNLMKLTSRAPRTRKPQAIRWSVESAARMGDVSEAQKQMGQLKSVARTLAFLQTTPMVAIGWQQLKTGDSAGLEKSLAEARSAADQLRPQGRYRYDAAVSLAALLAATGHMDDARELISKHQSSDPLGNLSAGIMIACEVADFDYAAAERAAPIGGWSAPQYSAVSALLVGHGYPDVALNWAAQTGDTKTRCEATMAWAEFLIRESSKEELPGNLAKIRTEIEKLSTASQALLQARLAWVLTDIKSVEPAQQAAAAAEKILSGIKQPAPVIFSNYKAVIDYNFPEKTPSELTALAWAEMARWQLANNKTEAGIASLQNSMQFTRAIAPGTLPVQKRIEQISSLGALSMRRELKNALNLPNDDEARSSFDTYNRYCNRLQTLASERFELQVKIIEALIGPNALEGIANLIREADSPNAGDVREAFLSTRLPDLLAGQFRLAGKAAEADELLRLIPQSAPQLGIQLAKIEASLAQENVRSAADQLSKLDVERNQHSRIFLSHIGNLVQKGQWKQAMQICLRLEQKSLSEEGLLLLSGQTTVLGKPSELIAFAKSQKPTLVDRISINVGIVLGLARHSEMGVKPVPPQSEQTAARTEQ